MNGAHSSMYIYSSNSLSSAAILNRRRRAMIACTNCRRRKIKCVTSEEPPRNPCQRCTKRDLHCEYVAVDDPPTPEDQFSRLPLASYHQPPVYPQPPNHPPTYPSNPEYAGYAPYPTNVNPAHSAPFPGPTGYPNGPFQYNQQTSTLPYFPHPQNQWAQGSIPQHAGCARCHGPCYCGGTGRRS
ncbi:hypothetical protein GGX14DRAFT_414810 [Mycena pura]|uniref:Zn(2)-C6 fungal-type domain-containing protein n=1 Tax=Mycena pura TaxID=153505 RepID=A0AAD6YT36_9AGAR|nr:hypothetical protein GGX14DRAFT_414810 [Mycena pura]